MGLQEAAGPTACPRRPAVRQPDLPSLSSAARPVPAPAAAPAPEVDDQVVLWLNQFPGEREERRKGKGREKREKEGL